MATPAHEQLPFTRPPGSLSSVLWLLDTCFVYLYMHIYAFIYLYIDVNLSVDIVNTYKPKYIHIYREIHVSLSIYMKRNAIIDTMIYRHILNMWAFSSGKCVGMPQNQR